MKDNNIKEDNTKKKTLIVLVAIILIVVIIAGATFAYWGWESGENQKTNVTFTAEKDFSCGADGGGSITSSSLASSGITLVPSSCANSSHVIKREIKLTTTVGSKTIYTDMWLNVNSLGSYLSGTENFKYALTTSSGSCDTDVVTSGNFGGFEAGDTISLIEQKDYSTTTTDTYYLWIWLDNEETELPPSDEESRTLDLSLGGSCADTLSSGSSGEYTDSILNGADPVVPTGLIPVTIANDGTVTTADTSSEWYNYTDKEWANAVLVSSSGTKIRDYYESNANVTVNQDDILAYYVWVPKYSYKMNGTEESISISFNSTPSGYTEHPAFTFEDNQSGMWVGKFETTGSATTPTILPNTSPLVSQKVNVQFQTALKFAGGTLSSGAVAFAGSDTYGLTDEANSHMMKNSEWGAAAYLSHSIYGINGEIRINNYFSYDEESGKTGCGASEADVYESETCDIAYGGATEYPQSTTGNITGIFDMSGGAYEYVMGVFANASGSLWTGYNASSNSGFNGLYGSSGTSYRSGIAFPTETKYYDKYQATSGTTISATTACSGGVCYGHALSETSGWYGVSAYFVSSSSPWFLRGGYSNGGSAGAFYFIGSGGGAGSFDSFRVVLTK